MKNIELEPGKLFYSIGEVADMFEVNTSLIRFWEKEFDIIKPKKNAKGNRLFTPADIENFKLIHYFVKDLGMTLEGAKALHFHATSCRSWVLYSCRQPLRSRRSSR